MQKNAESRVKRSGLSERQKSILSSLICILAGILVSIVASPDIGLDDVDICSNFITSEAAEGANVIWGVAFDEDMEDTMKVTVIATGFQNKNEMDKSFARNAAPAVRPVASGKIVNGVKVVK